MSERVALVTGASSGIGRAIAGRFAADGYRVFAAGRNAGRTASLAGESDRIRTWIGDLAKSSVCRQVVEDCLGQFGRLDVLVNNAGILRRGDAEHTSDEDWRDTLAVNLSVPFYLSRAAVPALRKTRGCILNVASDWGLVGGRNAVAYCASKGGLVQMTRAMAVDHAREGVRINAICPGDVVTAMLFEDGRRHGLDDEAALRQAAAGSRTGRVTTVEEVAALAAYLASDAAAQITGAAIPIDGGNTAA